MKYVDDLILELLESEDQSTLSVFAEDIDNHLNYVGTRCPELRDHGLLLNLARGLYQITEQGTIYLNGNLDASTPEEPD